MATDNQNVAIRRVAGVNPLAIKQASLLDETLFEHLEVVHGADLIKKTSAAVILSDIKRCFTLEIRKAWPRIDTGRTEDGEIDYSCNNPDWTKTVNGKRTVWVSYFDTLIVRSPYVMALASQIENIGDTLKGERDKSIDKILETDSNISTLESKITTFKQNFRKAVRLDQTEQAIAEYYPEMKYAYRMADDGENIKQVAEPVMAWPQELPLKGENFTITQFCGLDYKAVYDSGETDPEKKWLILMASKKRELPEVNDEDNIEITNFDRFETGAASMLDWLRNDKNVQKMFAKIDGKKNPEDYADFVLTLSGLSSELDDIATHFAKKIDIARDHVDQRERNEKGTSSDLTMEDADIPSYRSRFPAETKGLSDRQIYEVVAATDDDQEDADWRRLFVAKQRKVA